MNHVIHNISIIFIFFGIILLTYNLTKSYNKSNKSKVIQKKEYNDDNQEYQDNNKEYQDNNQEYQDKPSVIYNKMFTSPDVWMGYADLDTKENQRKLI